jgi:hypothetical protein
MVRTCSSAERFLPLALILFALVLRMLVPAGWMPATDGFGIKPCTMIAAAPATTAAASEHHHHEAPQPEDEQGAQPCSFTMFGAPFAFAPDAAVTPPPILSLSIGPVAAPAAALLSRRLAAPPPLPTGPPLFA